MLIIHVFVYYKNGFFKFIEITVAGIAPDTRQDDQHELVVRPENADNQTSTKQFLISCYKKSVKKEEVDRSSQDSIRASRRNSPLRGIQISLYYRISAAQMTIQC